MTQPTSVGGTREGNVWVALATAGSCADSVKEPLVTADAAADRPFVSTLGRRCVANRRVVRLEYGLPEGRNVRRRLRRHGPPRAEFWRTGIGGRNAPVRWDAGGALPGIYFYQGARGALRNTGRLCHPLTTSRA